MRHSEPAPHDCTQPQRANMNRQAVPSILLSVVIVCFFAVVLYEREPRARRSREGEGQDQSTPSPSRSQTPTAAPVDTAATTAVARPDAKPRAGAGPDAPIVTTRAVAPAVADRVNERRPPAGGQGRAELRVSAIQVKSNRKAGSDADRPAATRSTRAAPTQPVATRSSRPAGGLPSRGWYSVPRSGAATAVGDRPTTTWRER